MVEVGPNRWLVQLP